MKRTVAAGALVAWMASTVLLTGCNTSHPTGSAAGAVAGAAIGAGSVALLHGSKTMMVLTGLAGGAIGYYVTTLRYDSGGVIQSGGQVYKVGDQVGINIPADKLFEPNTAEFLPSAMPILDSAADILARYPNNNVIISGNTSGFYTSRWEQKLSEKRAQRVSAYLWNAGILPFKEADNNMRKLTYVGYGSYLPIASDQTNAGIRQNNHIQITSYPSECDLRLSRQELAMRNEGSLNDSDVPRRPDCRRQSEADFRDYK